MHFCALIERRQWTWPIAIQNEIPRAVAVGDGQQRRHRLIGHHDGRPTAVVPVAWRVANHDQYLPLAPGFQPVDEVAVSGSALPRPRFHDNFLIVQKATHQHCQTHYTDAENRKHWTFQLATLNRLDGNDQITTDMIVDNRRVAMAVQSGEFVHIQGTPAASWTVNHQLGSGYPTVAVYDDAGQQITPGGITIDSNDQITIDFDGTAVSGFVVVKVLTNL